MTTTHFIGERVAIEESNVNKQVLQDNTYSTHGKVYGSIRTHS